MVVGLSSHLELDEELAAWVLEKRILVFWFLTSFLACALTNSLDCSQDSKITCFKPEGSIGINGLNILREMRAPKKMIDGRNDLEEDGFEEEELTQVEVE